MSEATLLAADRLDDCWNRIGVWSRQGASCPQLKNCVHCRNCEHYSTAGRLLLERPVPEDYRRQWTQRYARPRQTAETSRHAVLLFRLGDEWLGINSHCVSEITRMQSVHSLPHCGDNTLKGLVNIRGELKLCVSIGATLQLGKASESHFTDHEILERIILIEKDDQSFVFPVSEVEGIAHYADHDLQALPATLANARSKLTIGIVRWQDRQVGILDHELLFYALARGLK
jgi:chemotaxis-related protein WspD